MSEQVATAHSTYSDHEESHGDHGHGPVMPEMKFEPADLERFDNDDTDAGKAIGIMLSLFFVYTIVAMSIAAWWTYSSL